MFFRETVRLICAVALGVAAASYAHAASYYIDSTGGNDRNNGLSERRAWSTLDKVNAAEFGPGDRILFRAGSQFRGQLHPRGSGRDGRPIVVDMYGTGAKPRIDAGGQFHEALLLENQDYWEVNNLDLTNTGATREPARYGARVRSWDHGVMRHIHLKNLFIHDVNGSLIKKDQGEGHGIVWENGGDKVKSRFDDLLIENCRLERTDRNGICGVTAYRPPDRDNRSVNVVIRGNVLEDIGGDGIKVWGCKGALVERNVLRGARRRAQDYAAGIWPWDSDDTVIQFNEVSGVTGTKDGQAFDSDAYTTNTLFQYNYTHDNDGGFMLVCCFENTGTVIRYNISQNDRTRLFHMAGSNQNVQIYNNVFYIAPGTDVDLFLWTGDRTGWTRDVQVRNNIFYVAGTASNSSGTRKKPDGTHFTQPGFGSASNVVFEHNVLYGYASRVPEEWKRLTADPQLVNPGHGGDGMKTVEGYKLKPGSPCIGAGVPIDKNGGRDFWGNPVRQGANPDIGVHQTR
ncbi:MAG TPA: right-handed parallel beta-helix repeat-containing protein [Bryobacteraceae bacterium]|nr:right-handed parallel beta-helix repeat-containing protein [Bryobacteraceae bacterium]